MKFGSSLFLTSATLASVLGCVAAQEGCEITELDVPIEMSLTDISTLMFVGVEPVVVARKVGEPMVKIMRHASGLAPR